MLTNLERAAARRSAFWNLALSGIVALVVQPFHLLEKLPTWGWRLIELFVLGPVVITLISFAAVAYMYSMVPRRPNRPSVWKVFFWYGSSRQEVRSLAEPFYQTSLILDGATKDFPEIGNHPMYKGMVQDGNYLGALNFVERKLKQMDYEEDQKERRERKARSRHERSDGKYENLRREGYELGLPPEKIEEILSHGPEYARGRFKNIREHQLLINRAKVLGVEGIVASYLQINQVSAAANYLHYHEELVRRADRLGEGQAVRELIMANNIFDAERIVNVAENSARGREVSAKYRKRFLKAPIENRGELESMLGTADSNDYGSRMYRIAQHKLDDRLDELRVP